MAGRYSLEWFLTPDNYTEGGPHLAVSENGKKALRLAEEALRAKGWDEVPGPLPSACWIWRGAVNRQGYGKVHFAGRQYRSHRLSYETYVGPIPAGALVRHDCDVTSCINPGHLVTGSYADNAQDCVRRGRKNPATGNRLPQSKLTPEDVVRARNLRATGLTLDTIAAQLGVNRSTVGYALRGDTWKGVK